MAKKDSQNSSKEKLLAEIERLKKELKRKKKYGLVWEDKPEDVVEMCKNKLPVLKEVKNKEIITDKDKPVNLLIEGDNYHALSVLNYTHEKKVDVIYIDPPYNTGNKDFIFNDKYVDSEDGYRHSKWLSFMGGRLLLAKNLLKNTGLIFISIDDNEMAQLRLLSDEIFGAMNFIANFVWKRRSGANDPKNLVSSDHEYLLCYKRSNKTTLKGIEKNLNNYKNPDNDPRGDWVAGDLTCGKTKDERPNLYYDIKDPKTEKIYKANPNRVWRFERERMLKEINDGKVLFPKKDGGVPQYKRFVKDLRSTLKPLSTWIESSIVKDRIIEDEEDFYNIRILQSDLNQSATKELRSVLGSQLFNYPKPKKLIKELIKHSCDRNATILDFMAGSGTTAHAVLELNKEDGGNRQFILCTNNENNICTDVCYPRIEKIINGYKNSKGEKEEGLGGNLKYFKTDFVDAEPTDKNKKKLTGQATEMLCIRERTFEPVMEQKRFKIFKSNSHYTGIIFDQLAIPEFKKAIKDIKGKFSVYVFSLGDDTFDEEFEDIKQKVKLSPIPEAILRVYRRIFK
jgi:adenine-specific DNA-methyltransferase